MSERKISHPSCKITAEIELPVSKSIHNRLLIIEALCDGLNFKFKYDCSDIEVLAKNLENYKTKNYFNTEDSGTAYRFLTALFAISPGERTLTASEQMKNRPVGQLVDALISMGADIKYLARRDYPPLLINGVSNLKPNVKIKANVSSQFVSALLLIAPVLPDGIELEMEGDIASEPYIVMTLHVMNSFGIKTLRVDNKIFIPKQYYIPAKYIPEKDWSSAAFWYLIAALSKKAEIILPGLFFNSLQGDKIVSDVFSNLGVKTHYLQDAIVLKKTSEVVPVFQFDFFNAPDLFPSLITACAFLKVAFVFRGMQNLEIKESNRVRSMLQELSKVGFFINYNSHQGTMHFDGIVQEKYPDSLMLDSHNDHRIAMALSAISLKVGKISINNIDCIKKSYPDFFKHLAIAGFNLST